MIRREAYQGKVFETVVRTMVSCKDVNENLIFGAWVLQEMINFASSNFHIKALVKAHVPLALALAVGK